MRGKQIALIAVIILIIGSFVIIPMLKDRGTDPSSDEVAANFTFSQNLATMFGKKLPLSFKVTSEDIAQTSIYLDDSLLKTWKAPKIGEISFTLDVSLFGLGAKTLTLLSVLKNGQEQNDSRLLRILSDVAPKQSQANVMKAYPHKPTSFTQGLEFNEGILYESTGMNGQSKIAQIILETGEIVEGKEIGLDETHFGEGISILNGEIFQLTWQSQKCFVYDKKTMQLKKEFPYTQEGWGLCNDGKSLIMSNGTEYLTFRDPSSFQIQKTIQVYDQVGPRVRLNELEYINGKIYANIWQLDLIIVIDPNSGKVLEEIDCSEIVQVGKGAGEVLNGIAFNSKTNKLYLTGKNWSKLLEVVVK